MRATRRRRSGPCRAIRSAKRRDPPSLRFGGQVTPGHFVPGAAIALATASALSGLWLACSPPALNPHCTKIQLVCSRSAGSLQARRRDRRYRDQARTAATTSSSTPPRRGDERWRCRSPTPTPSLDNATLQLSTAQFATTAVVAGTTYLFVTGFGDDGLSVFSVAADGRLTNVANVHDNATLELDAAWEVTTAVVAGTTYLFVAGYRRRWGERVLRGPQWHAHQCGQRQR